MARQPSVGSACGWLVSAVFWSWVENKLWFPWPFSKRKMKCACTLGLHTPATLSESAELLCACPSFCCEKFTEPARYAVGKRERGRSEVDWSLAVVQLLLRSRGVSRCSSALKLWPVVTWNFVYRKLLSRVSVLPQNLLTAINIASLSCSPTVTTVFAGKLVDRELESDLFWQKKKKTLVQCRRSFW